MATKTGFRQTPKQSSYNNGSSSGNSVVVDKPPSDDSLSFFVIIAFLIVFLFLLPVMGWVLRKYEEKNIKMESRLKEQDQKIERFERLIKKLEEK